MQSPPDSTHSGKEAEVKNLPENHVTPEAVTTERSLFKRANARAFDSDSLDECYAPIVNYEGAHRYDPKFEWTPQEEKRIVRKVC